MWVYTLKSSANIERKVIKGKLHPLLLSLVLHYFFFSSWHHPTEVKMFKSDLRRGKLRRICFEMVKGKL